MFPLILCGHVHGIWLLVGSAAQSHNTPFIACSFAPNDAGHSMTDQNAEIFTLTYGSIVRQLIADFEDMDEVNKQLDQM